MVIFNANHHKKHSIIFFILSAKITITLETKKTQLMNKDIMTFIITLLLGIFERTTKNRSNNDPPSLTH